METKEGEHGGDSEEWLAPSTTEEEESDVFDGTESLDYSYDSGYRGNYGGNRLYPGSVSSSSGSREEDGRSDSAPAEAEQPPRYRPNYGDSHRYNSPTEDSEQPPEYVLPAPIAAVALPEAEKKSDSHNDQDDTVVPDPDTTNASDDKVAAAEPDTQLPHNDQDDTVVPDPDTTDASEDKVVASEPDTMPPSDEERSQPSVDADMDGPDRSDQPSDEDSEPALESENGQSADEHAEGVDPSDEEPRAVQSDEETDMTKDAAGDAAATVATVAAMASQYPMASPSVQPEEQVGESVPRSSPSANYESASEYRELRAVQSDEETEVTKNTSGAATVVTVATMASQDPSASPSVQSEEQVEECVPSSSQTTIYESAAEEEEVEEETRQVSFMQFDAALLAAATATATSGALREKTPAVEKPPSSPKSMEKPPSSPKSMEKNHSGTVIVESEREVGSPSRFVDSSYPGEIVSIAATDVTVPFANEEEDYPSKPVEAGDGHDAANGSKWSRKRFLLLAAVLLCSVGIFLGVFFGARDSGNNNGDIDEVSSGANGTITSTPTTSPVEDFTPTASPSVSPMPTEALFTTELSGEGLVSVCIKDPADGRFESRQIQFQYAMQVTPESDAESIKSDVQDSLHRMLAWQFLTCVFERLFRAENGEIDFISVSSVPVDVLSETSCPTELVEDGSDCFMVDAGFTSFYLGEPVPDDDLVNVFLPFLKEQVTGGGELQMAHPNITGISFRGLVDPLVQSESPTASPTIAPTLAIAPPTSGPTTGIPNQPTVEPPAPSPAPVAAPTLAPVSQAPTLAIAPPTSGPTTGIPNQPTVEPPAPSPAPVAAPTLAPVSQPTAGPTKTPTLNPAARPTKAPSPEPPSPEPPSLEPPTSENVEPVTYVPGKLVLSDRGLLLSEGLASRVLVIADYLVPYGDGNWSDEPFHKEPSSGACFPHPDGIENGWAYVSNSASSDGEGGVGALYFDASGEIINYRRLLTGTNHNGGGGVTPWGTWISAEESAFSGQGFWEVHPWGLRLPTLTALGNQEPANWESFAYDARDTSDPKFFFTEDARAGPVWRFTPNPSSVTTDPDEMWRMLQTSGYDHEFLVLLPSSSRGGNFLWTESESEGKESAFNHFQNVEGIDCLDGTLAFTSKRQNQLFLLDLDSETYTVVDTTGGTFDGKTGDDVVYARNNDESPVLYLTEDGNNHSAGIHARDSSGNFFPIMEALYYGVDDQTSGFALSPDNRHMYVALQNKGVVFDIWREDGYAFDEPYLDIEYHQNP